VKGCFLFCIRSGFIEGKSSALDLFVKSLFFKTQGSIINLALFLNDLHLIDI
jgi:hypothetical protein